MGSHIYNNYALTFPFLIFDSDVLFRNKTRYSSSLQSRQEFTKITVKYFIKGAIVISRMFVFFSSRYKIFHYLFLRGFLSTFLFNDKSKAINYEYLGK